MPNVSVSFSESLKTMNHRQLLEARESRMKDAGKLTSRDKELRGQIAKREKRGDGEEAEPTDEEAKELQEIADKTDDLIAEVEAIDEVLDKADDAQAGQERAKALDRLEKRTHRPRGSTSGVRGPEPDQRDFFDDPTNLEDYSLLRAIKLRAAGHALDGFEAEVSQELAKRSGKEPQGFLVPWDLPVRRSGSGGREQRAFNAAAGAGALQKNLDGSMIDMLRNRMIVQGLGARIINDIVGELDIPKQTAGGTAYWLGEDGAPTESNQTVGQVQLRMKTVGAYTDITRKLMNQVSMDAEMFVRDDLMRTLAIEMDRAVLNGSGSNNQPTGLLQHGSLPTVAIGANGGAITWGKIVELETKVATANADQNALAYLATTAGRGAMKSIERFDGTGKTLWADDNTVNGYTARATNQMPSDLAKGTGEDLCPLVFGDWTSVIIGFWSGLDVMVDPYSKSTSGGVRVVALQDTDVNFRHIESFAAILDMDPSALS